MLKSFALSLTSLLLLSCQPAHAGDWVVSQEVNHPLTLTTTLSGGGVVGLLCNKHVACIPFVVPAEACQGGSTRPVLVNSAKRGGILKGSCQNFVYNDVKYNVILIGDPGQLSDLIIERNTVSFAIPDHKTHQIPVYTVDFTGVPDRVMPAKQEKGTKVGNA